MRITVAMVAYGRVVATLDPFASSIAWTFMASSSIGRLASRISAPIGGRH
jgi:hypothetical protein